MRKDYYKSENGFLEVKDMLSEDHTRFTEREAFYFGNILKYINRAGKKEGDVMESLDKALDYYHTMIKEHFYPENSESTISFESYLRRRIRTACISLGCIKNYNIFADKVF